LGKQKVRGAHTVRKGNEELQKAFGARGGTRIDVFGGNLYREKEIGWEDFSRGKEGYKRGNLRKGNRC